MEEETTYPKGPRYRELDEQEREFLSFFYEQCNGSVLEMSRDSNCPFHSRAQLTYYVKKYGFYEKLEQIRTEKREQIRSILLDAKMSALEQAMRILRVKRIPLHNKAGKPMLDSEGYPRVIEQLPDYRALRTAWKILKTELGEPTRITETDTTVGMYLTTPLEVTIAE